MDIPEILTELLHFQPRFPREAILAARERRAEIVPELLKVLDYTAEHLDEILEDHDYMGHIFAAFLLAEFREGQALPRLVRLLRQTDDRLQALWSDLLHICVPRLLAATCGRSALPLKELAEDLTSTPRARRQALQALQILYLNDELSREDLVKYLAGLLAKAQTDPRWQDPQIIGEIACLAFEIHPDELMLDLEPLYDRGLVEESLVTRADLRALLRRPVEDVVKEARDDVHNRLPFDVVVEMEGWPCYSDRQHAAHRGHSPVEAAERERFLRQFGAGDDDDGAPAGEPAHAHGEDCDCGHHHGHDHPPATPAKAPEGPGRNDPCPCGSGKKFKKCCGNRENLH
ncbi:MAG: DUF1186 domain-containing protein [Candidatus Riflebacteria bacterium]|nr:DUF1186 domain-containing protein [Candidatus Riflebacteria bacterium]